MIRTLHTVLLHHDTVPPSGPVSCQSFSLHHVDVARLEVGQ